jgi:hypothetical protein
MRAGRNVYPKARVTIWIHHRSQAWPRNNDNQTLFVLYCHGFADFDGLSNRLCAWKTADRLKWISKNTHESGYAQHPAHNLKEMKE